MKITKSELKQIIKECMADMGAPLPMSIGVSQPSNMPKQNVNIDPDGYEGRMTKGNLNRIAEYATMLQGIIQDNENLEPWVEEKIAVAASMMDSVGHYLKYEKMKNVPLGE